MSKLMIALVVLLSLAVSGLFLVKHKNASLRASLDRANNVASEQQTTITMLKNQLHVALTRADKNELAQVALTGLIESLSPSGRRRLSAELAKRLRQSQQRRVMAQKPSRPENCISTTTIHRCLLLKT